VTEHNNDLSYRVWFNNIRILAGMNWCTELLIREPAEIELNPNNINREDGFSLQRSLKPFIHSLKENKAAGGFQGQNSLTLTQVTTHTHTHTHTPAPPVHLPNMVPE